MVSAIKNLHYCGENRHFHRYVECIILDLMIEDPMVGSERGGLSGKALEGLIPELHF